MGKVIIFSGIDGSGKSTHACQLIRELKLQGKSAKYLWMRGRGRTFFSFPLLVLCRLLNITRVHKLKDGIQVSEYPFYAYKPLRLLWPWLQLVDSMLYTFLMIHLPQPYYDVVILDRSPIDTLVDIIADTRIGVRILQKLFLSLLPRNSIVIILDVNEEIALIRKKDILRKSYLSIRRRIYSKLAELYGWHVISTNGSFKTSTNSIKDIIFRTWNDAERT